jgi:ATP-dependent DNA helicase RecG
MPLTTQQLEALLRDMESDRVERKSSLADRERFLEAICAFANDLPDHRQEGVLFVGVHDDGSCAGLPITDDLLKTLSDMRSNGNILPFPQISVEKVTLEGCTMAAVVVHPSEDPPVRVRGRTWIRVGPRRAVATREEERRLSEKRRHKNLAFDLHSVPGATLNDLDLSFFQSTYLPATIDAEVLAANHRTVEEQLSSVRFIDEQKIPTVLGLLVAGKNPRDFLPGAYVQFLRLDGVDLVAPVKDQREISGPITQVMSELDSLLRAHISIRTDVVSNLTETRSPDYPLVALRQLLGNAVMHRSYEGTHAPIRVNWFEDRIEILNPGGPYGQVTLQNFGRPGITDYRNPHLAEAMKNLGFVQRFGIGISLARAELSKNGNPEPEFQPEDSYLLVIVRKRP